VKFLRAIGISMVVFMVSTTAPAAVLVASATDTSKNFKWIDLSACKKPPKAFPQAQKESYRTYNIQRRYVDLDQDGTCEVMDVWIERLGESPSPGMRVLEKRYFRYKDMKWQKSYTNLKFYPYAIRSEKTGEILYVEAPSEYDVSDNIVLGMQEIRIFTPSGWDEESGSLDKLILKPYQGQPGPFLQALAFFLTEHLAQQKATTKKRRATNSTFDWNEVDEREKILWILQEANQTLDATERLPVGADGLPLLPPK
jgi:hypothetical protein